VEPFFVAKNDQFQYRDFFSLKIYPLKYIFSSTKVKKQATEKYFCTLQISLQFLRTSEN
jgi:hypothetical protein